MIEKEYAKCLCLIKKATVCFSKFNQDNTENSSKIVPKYLTRFSNRNLVKRLKFLEIECHSKLKGYAVEARCIETLISKKQCDIRPECEKCNLCRIRIFSSEPSGLVIIKN